MDWTRCISLPSGRCCTLSFRPLISNASVAFQAFKSSDGTRSSPVTSVCLRHVSSFLSLVYFTSVRRFWFPVHFVSMASGAYILPISPPFLFSLEFSLTSRQLIICGLISCVFHQWFSVNEFSCFSRSSLEGTRPRVHSFKKRGQAASGYTISLRLWKKEKNLNTTPSSEKNARFFYTTFL